MAHISGLFVVIDDWEIVRHGYFIISNICDELDIVDEFPFFIMKMLAFSLNIFNWDGYVVYGNDWRMLLF